MRIVRTDVVPGGMTHRSSPGTGRFLGPDLPREFRNLLSQTAEYALRAVVSMGTSLGQPLTTQVIAEKTRVPAGYLSKVLQALCKVGIVESHRGLRGGYGPSAPAQSIDRA